MSKAEYYLESIAVFGYRNYVGDPSSGRCRQAQARGVRNSGTRDSPRRGARSGAWSLGLVAVGSDHILRRVF